MIFSENTCTFISKNRTNNKCFAYKNLKGLKENVTSVPFQLKLYMHDYHERADYIPRTIKKKDSQDHRLDSL